MANLITVNDLKVHFVGKQGIFTEKTKTAESLLDDKIRILKDVVNKKEEWRVEKHVFYGKSRGKKI